MRLLEARRGDAHETALHPQLVDGARTGVEHRLPQAAEQLVDHRRDRSAVGHLALDALGDELLVAGHIRLEVAVTRVARLLAAGLKRTQRAHAAVALELLAVDEDQIARALVGARQQRPEHHGLRTRDERLGDVAGVLQAAVGDDRDARVAGRERCLVHRGDLGHADSGHDAGGADRAGTHAHLHGVGTGIDESLGSRPGCHVSTDDIDRVEGAVALEPTDDVENSRRVTVGGVDDDHVDARVAERARAVPGITEEPDRRADPQTSLVILGGVRVLLALVEVLDRDEPAETTARIHQRELLDLVLGEDGNRAVGVDAHGSSDQGGLRHDVPDEGRALLEGGDEAHVAVGDDADQATVALHNRQP